MSWFIASRSHQQSWYSSFMTNWSFTFRDEWVHLFVPFSVGKWWWKNVNEPLYFWHLRCYLMISSNNPRRPDPYQCNELNWWYPCIILPSNTPWKRHSITEFGTCFPQHCQAFLKHHIVYTALNREAMIPMGWEISFHFDMFAFAAIRIIPLVTRDLSRMKAGPSPPWGINISLVHDSGNQ